MTHRQGGSLRCKENALAEASPKHVVINQWAY